MYQCDDTIFHSRFEPKNCMRTFSQSETTRLLSSLQGASLSQQHRRRCHRIQGPYHQYPQVPTVSLVPCPTLLNTVPTHFTHDETQRVATKPDFHQHFSEIMTATLCVSAECPLTVDAHSWRATNQDNAHQRHTRSVQSSS